MSDTESLQSTPILTTFILVLGAAALLFTWWRLFQGMDLLDESFYVAVPYRWALGDRPFANETNILQICCFFTYPLVKLFVTVTGGATGIVVFMRHMWMLYAIGVAAAVFGVLRKLVRWQYALAIAAINVTYIMFTLPQLSYNTLGAGFLTLGVALALWTILLDRGRRWLFAAGVAHGLAAIGFITFVAIVPMYALFLALALRRQRRALWRAVWAYVAGAGAVGIVTLAFSLSWGWSNVWRSVTSSLSTAKVSGQAGGLSKAVNVLQGYERFVWSRPYLLIGLLLVYFVYLRRPAWGRSMLVLMPVVLWLSGQNLMLDAGGMSIAYAFLTPYLYLFVPARRRPVARTLLLWIAVPSIIAGWFAGFSSAEGYPHSQIGLMPALIAGGLFLAWSLEAVGDEEESGVPIDVGAGTEKDAGVGAEIDAEAGDCAGDTAGSGATAGVASLRRRLALVLTPLTLAGVVVVTIIFQFQFIPRQVPYSQLTTWMGQGPYWGIHTTVARRTYLDEFARDLRAQSRPGDSLLVMYQFPGAYLYWSGKMASNSVWISQGYETGPLPQVTIDYYRRTAQVPDLVLRALHPGDESASELLADYSGGFPYKVTLMRRGYFFMRRPAGLATAQIIADLESWAKN